MTVVDASVMVASLIESNPIGDWADSVVLGSLAAPHHMPAEVTNILRRSLLAGDIAEDIATAAHDELLQHRIELYPYAPLAERVWELRSNITAYDAWYVALAEALGVKLATLDVRLARASGPRCEFLTPDI